MIIIRNAHLLSPDTGTDRIADIRISDGKVAEISKRIQPEQFPDATIIDASGLYAAPGFVDVHTHFRDPGFTEKEDIHTGAQAAAAGGYTTIVCMANTSPAVDSPETLSYVYEKASKEKIHILQDAAVTVGRAGKELVDMKALMDAGAPAFTDDGTPIMDEALVKRAMEKAAELNTVLSFHEEDPAYIGVAGYNAGAVAESLGIKGADRKAETVMVERDIKLALETGCAIDIQHISAAETVELIRKAKKNDPRGLIHAEATPNHFSMTEEAVREYGTLAKINPPLRTEDDRQAIIQGLKDGTIDLIATDHAPHTAPEKEKPLTEAPSGIIGLETAFSLGLENLVLPGHLSLMDLIRRMSTSPAELYHLDAGKIKVGSPADIVLFSTERSTTYNHFESRSSNSPYLGKTLPGSIEYTIAGGHIVKRP
ncbi:dihydroorotase [Lachnospiraceae bacterium]|nr:dihydroorotase [Lachnospiraceae bacterium]